MKTKLRRFSKRSVSILLALIMMLSMVSVGTVVVGAAYTSIAGRIYFDNSKTNWSNVYLYVGHSGYGKSYTLTNTGYHNIWYLDTSDTFTDRTKLYFANHNDSPNGQNYGIDTQYSWNTDNSTRTALTTANNADANSLFTPSSASAGTLTRSYPRVVAGDIASNGWDDCTDIMTYSSSQWTKTYTNVSIGDYSFAVVGFYNNWNPTYRWAAKNTLTDNDGCGSWANANDDDQNIKLTLTKTANVTITLTSSNKVNVTLTAVTHTATRTAPSNGTLYVGTSSSSVSSTSITVAEGSTYYIKATPAEGYKLATLKVGSTSVIGNNTGATSAVTVSRVMGTSDETVTATFTKITYSVTYNKGSIPGTSGSISGTVPSTQTKTYGVDLTLATNAFTYTGYTQKGWATSDGGAQAYASGATYTGNAALSLYPYWEANTYTITYKDGGNTDFSGTHASGYPTSYTYGVGATLKSATKDNYIFGGWFDNSSCTGTAVTSISTTATGNKTYYAKWTLAATPQLASISDVSKTVNDTSFNATTTINNSSYATGTLSVTASSGTTSVATVGTVTTSGDNVTIPITVIAPGTSTITVTLKDGTTTVDTKTFTVTVAEPSLSISNRSIYVNAVNATAPTLTASPTPTSHTWTSGTTANVTINSSTGTLTAVKNGTSTITYSATYGCGYTKSATCTVTVANPTLTIQTGTNSGNLGDTTTASVATASSPAKSSIGTYTWTTSDSSIVEISDTSAASPTLTFKKNGTATIGLKVKYTGNSTYEKTATNTVTITVGAPTISMDDQSVVKGDRVTFSASSSNPSSGFTYTYALNSAVSGVSINSSTGEVSVASSCTASSATIKVTATYLNYSTTKTATLTIDNPSLTLTNTNISDGDTVYATIGTNITSTLTNYFSGSYTVNSSNTAAATASITNGVLTISPQAKGVTTITVTASKSSYETITVTKTFTVKVAAAASTDVVVYLQDFTYSGSDGWGAAYIHTWETDGGAAISDRAAMTKIGVNSSGRSVYAYRFTAADWAKVKHIVFLHTNGDGAWNDQWEHTEDKFAGTHGSTTAFQLRSDSTGSARKLDTSTISITIPDIQADDIDDLPIETSTSMTANVLNNVVPSSYTWTRSSESYLTLANATTTSNSNTLTGTYPGTTTVTIKAYAALPTGWTSIVTDGTADDFLAGTAIATVTTTATPKTVTWGKMASTDNGQNFNTAITTGNNVTVSPNMTNGGSVDHGTVLTFTAPSTITGYKFAGWQVNGTNTLTTTTTKEVTVTANTTVYAIYYKTCVITVNKGTGVTSYKTNHSSYTGTYTSNQTFTVNAGSTFNITNINYDNGYEADSTNSSNLSNSNVQSAITATIAAKKKTYNLTGAVSPTSSPAHGTVTFYSNEACTTQITTSQVGNTIYAKYTPNDDYVVRDFSISGTGASLGTKTGNVTSITMGYANLTVTANVILEYSVTYYVDMHSASVTSLSAAVVSSGSGDGGAVQTDSSGEDCSASLTKQGTSSVYAATISTPVTSGSPLYFKIVYNGTAYLKTLTSAQVTTLAGKTTKEVWLEAVSDSDTEKSITYSSNTVSSVSSGMKRIYLEVPSDWGSEWTETGYPKLYHWGDYDDIGWENSVTMHQIGTSKKYYYDIRDDAKYIIFRASDKQTEDITISTNSYLLTTSDGKNYGTPQTDAVSPSYSRRPTNVVMKKTDTGVSIKPDMPTGCTATYSESSNSFSVSANGVISATARTASAVNVTVNVTGSLGESLSYTVPVTIKDPSVTSEFKIMSLESYNSTVTIPAVSNNQPAYFDSISTNVSGLANGGTSTNSAIVTSTATTSVSEIGTKTKTYTVKYAKTDSNYSSTFGYSSIAVTADVVSKSIRYSGANRYGYKQWTITPSGDTAPTATTKVDGGVETSTTTGITLLGKTYSEIFEAYTYVDVTFTYNYYTYKPKTVQKKDDDGNVIAGEYETEYYYDADYIDPDNHGVSGCGDNDYTNDAEDRDGTYFNASNHELQTYTVSNFEIRGKTASNITAANIYSYTYDGKTITPALNALADMPENDYYNYVLNASTVKTPSKTGDYNASVTVELLHKPKTYVVKLDGTEQNNTNDGSRNNGTQKFFYQEYAKLTKTNSVNWCITDKNNSSTGTAMATGKSYSFRVTGNTYLKTVTASISDDDFNRSKVTHAGQVINHEAKSTTDSTVVEKLTNNFYISDFFVPEFVKNGRGLQEDDVKFVGGGVIYYQMNNGTVDAKVANNGYADSSGVGFKDSLTEFIQDKIEAASVPSGITNIDNNGRNEICYDTEIKATSDSTSGLRYRYLPYYKINGSITSGEMQDDGKTYIPQVDDSGSPVYKMQNSEYVLDENGDKIPLYYILPTETQDSIFRYSNSLRAYQYIYADKKENKATNNGKNMRLYSYYVYSYTDYDVDTDEPYTVYKVVLSDEYSDASTYWDN